MFEINKGSEEVAFLDCFCLQTHQCFSLISAVVHSILVLQHFPRYHHDPLHLLYIFDFFPFWVIFPWLLLVAGRSCLCCFLRLLLILLLLSKVASGCFSEKATIGISCLCCFLRLLLPSIKATWKQHRQLIPMVAFSEKQPEKATGTTKIPSTCSTFLNFFSFLGHFSHGQEEDEPMWPWVSCGVMINVSPKRVAFVAFSGCFQKATFGK